MRNPRKNNQEQIISVANLISQFSDPALQKRVNSAQNLKAIGTGLGKERIRSELIPFLQTQLVDDESDVLIALLENVEILGQLMGGGLGYTCLYTLLEEILQNQDQKVRSLAVERYYEIVSRSQIKKSQSMVMASINRIMKFGYEQAKEAVALIIAKLLGQFSTQNQQILVTMYQEMSQSTSNSLKKFASIYSQYLVKWLNCSEATILKIIDILFKDKQQSNKIYLIDTIIQLAKLKSPAFLQPYFNLISYQFTWRVRYELISKAEFLGEALGRDNFKVFLSYVVKYINDIEPEIRSISCIKLKQIIKFVQPQQITNRILPALKNTHIDSHTYVRSTILNNPDSLAQSVLFLCATLPKKQVTQWILPKFLQLLKDQDQQVRITIFKHIDLICKRLGTDTLSQSILPAMVQLSTHQNWRIRVQSIHVFLYFVKESGTQFMNQKNIKMAMDYLRDSAYKVRSQAFLMMEKILELLGTPWFEKNILPKLMQIFKATSYLQRETVLLALEKLLPKLTQQILNKTVIAPILAASNDSVSNVRMCACRVLQTLYPLVTKEKDTIKKQVKTLKSDKDKDVRDMALETETKLQ